MAKTPPQPKSGLIWERLAQADRPRTPGLSREQIVRAAIELADSAGTGDLTMRRLAGRLGAAPMSLYRHVASKEDLLDLMLDEVFGDMALPDAPSGDWRADLHRFAYASRDTLRRHPWAIPLLTSRPTLGPQYLRWFEFGLAAVAGQGIDTATMAQVVGLISGYVGAAVGYEAAEAEHTRRIGLDEAQKRAIATPYVGQVIASGRYPNFARWLSEGASLDPDTSFAFGIECVLDGIAVRLAQRRPQ